MSKDLILKCLAGGGRDETMVQDIGDGKIVLANVVHMADGSEQEAHITLSADDVCRLHRFLSQVIADHHGVPPTIPRFA